MKVTSRNSKGKSDIQGTLREDYPQKEGKRASPKPLPLACSDYSLTEKQQDEQRQES